MEIEPKFLAHCGLYCGVCGVYYATRDNNTKFLERLLAMYAEKFPGLEGFSIEDLKCEDCRSERVGFFVVPVPSRLVTRSMDSKAVISATSFRVNISTSFLYRWEKRLY